MDINLTVDREMASMAEGLKLLTMTMITNTDKLPMLHQAMDRVSCQAIRVTAAIETGAIEAEAVDTRIAKATRLLLHMLSFLL